MTLPSETPPIRYHVLMASFAGTETAADTVERLKSENAFDGYEIEGEALVWRDQAGKVHLHERGGAGVGAVFGATAAGIVGLLTGPVILPLMMIVGGLLGGLTGRLVGQFVPPEDLRRVAEALPPGSSAYLAVVDSAHAEPCGAVLGDSGAEVLNVPVETELSNAIREGITHDIMRA